MDESRVYLRALGWNKIRELSVSREIPSWKSKGSSSHAVHLIFFVLEALVMEVYTVVLLQPWWPRPVNISWLRGFDIYCNIIT